jgi:hypothetical protein
MTKWFILTLLFLLLSPRGREVHAQMHVDTVRSMPKSSEDTSAFHMTRSPTLALGLSALLPGLGQVYLNQWWKVPIIYAVTGVFVYGALIQNFRYHYTADSVVNQTNRGDLGRADQYSRLREFYRDDRDKFYIYTGLVYIANILDAYIAANLFDFDVSDSGPVAAPSSTSKLMFSPADTHYRIGIHLPLR